MDADDNDNEKQQRRMMVVMKLKQLHTTITNYNYHKLNRGHHKKFLFSDKVLHIANRSQLSTKNRTSSTNSKRRASYESATDMLRLQSEPSALQVDMLGTHMQSPALLCFPV